MNASSGKFYFYCRSALLIFKYMYPTRCVDASDWLNDVRSAMDMHECMTDNYVRGSPAFGLVPNLICFAMATLNICFYNNDMRDYVTQSPF
jgi:hypothetical protein